VGTIHHLPEGRASGKISPQLHRVSQAIVNTKFFTGLWITHRWPGKMRNPSSSTGLGFCFLSIGYVKKGCA
jgi:hypothetical protein